MDKSFKWNNHTYTYIEPSSINVRRSAALAGEIKVLDYGMSIGASSAYDTTLSALNKEALELLVDGKGRDAVEKLQEVDRIVNAHKQLLELKHKRQPLLELAKFVILVDDEDVGKIDSSYNTLKLSQCTEHPEVSLFFLSIILPLYGTMIGLKNYTDIWEYLNQEWVVKTEQLFYKYLHSR